MVSLLSAASWFVPVRNVWMAPGVESYCDCMFKVEFCWHFFFHIWVLFFAPACSSTFCYSFNETKCTVLYND